MKTFECKNCQKSFEMPDNVVSIKCDICNAELTVPPAKTPIPENSDQLPAELQQKLDAVEEKVNAEQPRKFDSKRGINLGLLCFGLFFTFGIVLRSGAVNALIFGFIGGLLGFLSGAIQRPVKK